MRIKYRISDGEDLAMWPASGEYTPPSGYAYKDGNYEFPTDPLKFYTFNGTSLVRKSESEIALIRAIDGFSDRSFSESLLVRFNAGEFSNPQIRFEYGALKEFARRKTREGFVQMKAYILAIYGNGQDYQAINESCQEQGVNLDVL